MYINMNSEKLGLKKAMEKKYNEKNEKKKTAAHKQGNNNFPLFEERVFVLLLFSHLRFIFYLRSFFVFWPSFHFGRVTKRINGLLLFT